MLLASKDHEVEADEDAADEADEDRVGSAAPGPKIAEGLLVDIETHRLGDVGGTASGHDVNDVEDFEGIDHSQHDRDAERAQDLRKRDLPELAPGPGPVDGGGLIELRRDDLKSRQHDERDERVVLPDIGQDHHVHDRRRVAQPGPVGIDQVQLGQEGVPAAEFRIEYEPPHHRIDDGRKRPGQHDQGPDEEAAVEFLIEQQGHQDAQDYLDADGDEGKIEAAEEGIAEVGV